MSKERRTIARWMLTLLVAGLAASVVIFTGARVAKAHIVPFPCDFTTGGGFFGTVKFRARTEDNSDPSPGRGVDKFGLKLTGVSPPFTGISAVIVSTRVLAGGHIELHKPNPSNTGPSTPPDEITACGSDDSGLGY